MVPGSGGSVAPAVLERVGMGERDARHPCRACAVGGATRGSPASHPFACVDRSSRLGCTSRSFRHRGPRLRYQRLPDGVGPGFGSDPRCGGSGHFAHRAPQEPPTRPVGERACARFRGDRRLCHHDGRLLQLRRLARKLATGSRCRDRHRPAVRGSFAGYITIRPG